MTKGASKTPLCFCLHLINQIGMPLSGHMVDIITRQDNPTYMKSYHHHVYQVINPRLDYTALNIAAALEAKGFQALPVADSLTTDEKNLKGMFTHKLAANLAGLGWIGKSCFLITPKYALMPKSAVGTAQKKKRQQEVLPAAFVCIYVPMGNR
ncbi:hypothetical protein [Phosphitispora fastidiosa]|uniref:hypothetical protein n=1 Tax=Phosphitispora fastidiosa TaxID=2837202 RepID=UPI001E5F733B|nr:hypothetical protein [Phosphitispora fastidiosa]MBU7008435.1 hypothetical protein [Phosphitispora fastidiosa]